MQKKQSMVADRLTTSVAELQQTFGTWKTAWALLRAARRQHDLDIRMSDLSNRMLRDMGLPERDEIPAGSRRFLWDIRK